MINETNLSCEEIALLVRGYVSGDIPDYQMSAWAKAVYYKGMTPRETGDLTLEMAHSGVTHSKLKKLLKY